MKELNQPVQDKTEVHAIAPIKKELKVVATLNPKPGQKIWQLDLTTMLITEAEYKYKAIDLKNAASGDMSVRGELIMKRGCIYCCAINGKNADKRFIKMVKKHKHE